MTRDLSNRGRNDIIMNHLRNNSSISQPDQASPYRERGARGPSFIEIFPSSEALVVLVILSLALGAMYVWFMAEEIWKVFIVGGAIFCGIILFVFVYSMVIWIVGKQPGT